MEMENNLNILYQIENLIQTALVEHPNTYLEDALQLLNEIITDIELSSIENENDDNENDIPSEENF